MQQNPFNRPTNQPDSYKTLIVFRKSECVYDITFYFVSRFLERSHDRTVDQMQQAARSGKQNIVEGYSDAEGSTEIEHKLTVIDSINEQTRHMATQIAELNRIYARMIEAMSVQNKMQ